MSSDTRALVSIIVPCHNCASTVSYTLRSCTQQTYSNVEIICVENGSTDDTLAVLESARSKDPRITIISNSVTGLAPARFCGFTHSHGLYIAFLDADDYLEPDFIEELLNAILTHQADLAQCGIRYVFDEKSFIHTSPAGILEGHHIPGRIDVFDGKPFVTPQMWNKLYSRQVISGYTLRNSAALNILYEDSQCMPLILARCCRAVIIADALHTYDKRASLITGSHTADLTKAAYYFHSLLESQRPYFDQQLKSYRRRYNLPLPGNVVANIKNYLQAVIPCVHAASNCQQVAFNELFNCYIQQLSRLVPIDSYSHLVSGLPLADMSNVITIADRNTATLAQNIQINRTKRESERRAADDLELRMPKLDRKIDKDPDTYVFTAWGRYPQHTLDNPRAIFERVKHCPHIKKIVLSHGDLDPTDHISDGDNTHIYPLKSKEGIRALMGAGVVFTAYSLHNLFGYRTLPNHPERRIVQLWHGIPIKRVALMTLTATTRYSELFWLKETKRYSLVISTSELDRETMISSFAPGEPKRVVLTGLPRHDFLNCPEDDLPSDYKTHQAIINKQLAGRRLVLFSPTWSEDPNYTTYPAADQLSELSKLFSRHNAVFGIRLHPHTLAKHTHMLFQIVNDWLLDFSAIPDPCLLLRSACALITDQSSIYLDFMHLGKPVLLYSPAINYYSKHRGFNYKPKIFTPHDYQASSFRALYTWCEKVLSGDSVIDACYKTVYNNFHYHPADGSASMRVLSALAPGTFSI
jgi:glycosyltransferase involved in cell wall biosynthesis/CDP-glycerol glycerophosphotransferase (TagB/SpsB family)